MQFLFHQVLVSTMGFLFPFCSQRWNSGKQPKQAEGRTQLYMTLPT